MTPPKQQDGAGVLSYPPLPKPTSWQIAVMRAEEDGDTIVGWRDEFSETSFNFSCLPKRTMFTAEQMRAYIDADRKDRQLAACNFCLGEATKARAALASHENAGAVAWLPPEREDQYVVSDFINASRTEKAGWVPVYLATPSAALDAREKEPIDMVLHCPKCGLQHIDRREHGHGPYGRTVEWDNPPHKSHLCHGCGHIWRPADVPTNGVRSVRTTGKADSPIASLNQETGGTKGGA